MADNSKTIPPIESAEKKPATFRLSLRSLRLIALAVNDARANNRLATKGEMVEQALLATYGHLDTGKRKK